MFGIKKATWSFTLSLHLVEWNFAQVNGVLNDCLYSSNGLCGKITTIIKLIFCGESYPKFDLIRLTLSGTWTCARTYYYDYDYYFYTFFISTAITFIVIKLFSINSTCLGEKEQAREVKRGQGKKGAKY